MIALVPAKGREAVAVRLNQSAFDHAKHLINEGHFVADQRDAWSEHQPSAADENEFIRLHGYDQFGKWHLGINDEKHARTKGRTSSRTAISPMSIVARYFQRKAVRDSTSTPISRRPPIICMR